MRINRKEAEVIDHTELLIALHRKSDDTWGRLSAWFESFLLSYECLEAKYIMGKIADKLRREEKRMK